MGMTYADAQAGNNRIVLEQSLVSHEQHRRISAGGFVDPIWYESGRAVHRWQYVAMNKQDAFDWAAHISATDGPYYRKTGGVTRGQGNLWTVDISKHTSFDTANVLYPIEFGLAHGVKASWQFENSWEGGASEPSPSGTRTGSSGLPQFSKDDAATGTNRIHIGTDVVQSGVKLNALFGVTPFRVQLIHERFKYYSMSYSYAVQFANTLMTQSRTMFPAGLGRAPILRNLISIKRSTGLSNGFDVFLTKVWPVDTRPQAVSSGGQTVVHTVTASA